MPELKKTVPDKTGKLVDGTVVRVRESIERFSDIELDDGSTLRIKPVVTEVVRVNEQWDEEGNPLYVIKSTNILFVVESTAELKQKKH